MGCSESDYLNMLLHLDLCGVDVRPPIAQAPHSMLFVQGDVTKQPFRPDCFDLVVCISTLEHIGANAYRMETLLGADILAMSELMRSTRRGGRLLVTVPMGDVKIMGG